MIKIWSILIKFMVFMRSLRSEIMTDLRSIEFSYVMISLLYVHNIYISNICYVHTERYIVYTYLIYWKYISDMYTIHRSEILMRSSNLMRSPDLRSWDFMKSIKFHENLINTIKFHEISSNFMKFTSNLYKSHEIHPISWDL